MKYTDKQRLRKIYDNAKVDNDLNVKIEAVDPASAVR